MAATDKPYRKQKTLDIVFAVSCILMLLSVLWMLVADYNRQFKAVQRTFRDVESVLNERQMLAQLPDPGDVEAARKLVADRRQARDDEKAKAQAKEQELTAKRGMATASYRAIKADFDSKSSFYNIEIGERDQEGISREVRKERAERVEAQKEELDEIQKNLDDAQKAVDAADAEYQREITDKLTQTENDLADAEDALKKLTGNFDRFAKQTVQKEWGFSDAFRSMPILDAFESPTKIKQIVLADLPIEYGSFKYVTRYDRCTSCHMAVERVGFDHRTLTKLTRSKNDARESRRAAVKAAINDIIASVGEGLPKDAHDQLAALDKAVDKGNVVTRVEARAPGSPAPPPATPEATSGKAVKVEKDKITVQAADGKETTFAVPAEAVVVIDGAPDKLENVKPNSLVTVLKGDDADPFQVIGGLLSKLRDPDAYGPEIVAAVSDPSLQADLIRVKQENEDFREAQSLPKKLETARRILQGRKDKGESLGFEPGDLPSHARTVSLTPGEITQFASHPRLDLFVDSNSPHPMESFGCTVCHAGQGSATDFQLSVHTPADARQQSAWESAYHWHATRDWEFPMLSSRFVESSCLKCHHEVTDLVREGNKEEAPKLLRGFNLVRESGCFGCHEIAGIKSGREIGPDLRLEPQPALEWLSPTEQDKAKADPLNPPGTYRKIGPSLRRIAEKTNEEWARRWIQQPRGFRPDTKMPHFYDLSNDSPNGPDALPDDQKDFPAAEIHSIAHYLFSESNAGLNGADTYRLALEGQITELEDRLDYTPLEDKDRKALAEATHRLADLALLSAPRRAAKIDELAASLREAQDQLLERYPKQADLEQKIAELETKAVKLAEADLAEDGNEDATLAKDVDALKQEFTKAAGRSLELARKYVTGIETKEVAELADVKAARDKAFQALLAKAAPVLQQRIADRQKAVDELQRALDAPKKAVADAQDRVKKAADPKAKAEEQKGLDKAKKELADATKDLDKKLEQPEKDLARVQNEKKEVDQAKDDETRLAAELTALVQGMDRSRKDMTSLGQELEKESLAAPILARVKKPGKDEYDFVPQIVDEQGEPVKPESIPAPDKGRLGAGRRVFSERGCLACHVHNGVREKGTNPGDPPPVPDAAAEFAPDLSRVAAKIGPKTGDPKEDATARRLWVVQWVLNPNIYHPRTRMPITHLTVQQACDVADWLLSQEVKPGDLTDWKEGPEEPKPAALVALARLYLAKAPGMTSAKVDEILPADALSDARKPDERVAGLLEADYAHTAHDADEASLVDVSEGKPERIRTKDLPDKLKWYVGKKAIGRLGCYGCHDVPGFETAKPIGTALNDWGKKDPERLAFEDADAYVRDHYHVVDARYDAANPNRPNPDFRAVAGKEPYEQVFFDALEHHTREGFLHQKLTEPRSYDYHRIRAWDDRLRMPQFRFARSRPRPGESETAYAARQEREEAEAREAVMTFILGLTAEPIPPKYLNTPKPDQLAEVQGRKVLEKFNCIGCHQVRPGVYDIKPSKETLAALERAYQTYASDAAKKDHVFPGHNAWTGLGSPWPDRLTVYGTEAQIQPDKDTGRDALSLRLIEAMHFTNNDRVAHDVPAGMTAMLPPEDVIDESPPFGGAFANLLLPYLKEVNSDFGKVNEARSVLPPPLIREGERVQPKWLYQFLLDPGTVRPPDRMRLRMPKFNMSGEEAMALVNYFGAADKLGNPGAGITYPYLTIPQTEEKYWHDQNEDYLKRLEAAWPAGKGLDQRAKDLLAKMAASIQPRLDAAKAAKASATASNDEKAQATAEAAALQASIDRWNYEAKQPDASWAAANKQAESIRKLADVREALKTAQGDEKTHEEAEEKDLQGAIDKANADFKNAYVADLKQRLTAAQDALKNAKDAEKAAKQADVDALQADVDRADKEGVVNDAAELLAQWRSPEAYPADAYRLAAHPAICLNCHNIGGLRIQGAKGPDLGLAAERLRPEWTMMWVANPDRMFGYSPTMPQNFPNVESKDQLQYQEYFAGDPREQVRAVRDVLMGLPRLENMPANRATRAAVMGGK